MSVLHRTRNTRKSPASATPAPVTPPSAVDELSQPLPPRASRTRISAAWFGVMATTIGAARMAQLRRLVRRRRTEVSS